VSQTCAGTPPGAAQYANFGRKVAVYGDTAIIGAVDPAYVFVRSGTTWTLQAELSASGSSGFGSSVRYSVIRR
jgi:hypothetical protein